MKQTRYSEKTLRRYLVGEMPAPEQAALETEYFADRELYDQICEAENDLISDYVRGRLAPDDRERFERHYLSTPEKLQQVEFSRAMARSLAQTGSTGSAEAGTPVGPSAGLADWWSSLFTSLGRPNFALGFSLVLAALLVFGGGWLLMNTLRLRREVIEAQSGEAALRKREQELKQQIALDCEQNKQLTAELESVRERLRIAEEVQTGQHSTPATVTILLSDLIREQNKQKTFRVPPNTETLQIQFRLKSHDSPTYQATVNTVEGKNVWSRKQLRLTGTSVLLRVPAKLFPTGDYILTLSPIKPASESESASQYYFRIDRR